MRTRARGESALLLLDVVQVLHQRSIDYAVVGAMAAAVHGVIRASMDADAVVLLAVAQAQELRAALEVAGLTADLRRGDPDDPIAAVLALKDGFGNRVDLLIGLRGIDSSAYERAIDVTLHDESIRVVSCEDFVAMKLFAGGPIDLRDAEQAFRVNVATIDRELLRLLCRKYGRDVQQKLEALLVAA
jgi:hypothetical protein